jgi:hypothetical protein
MLYYSLESLSPPALRWSLVRQNLLASSLRRILLLSWTRKEVKLGYLLSLDRFFVDLKILFPNRNTKIT